MDPKLKAAARRLEAELVAWREEPMHRVSARNTILRPVRTRQFGAFGAGSIVDRPIWLYGARKIAVGDRVIVLRGGWLAVERLAWEEPSPVLKIGHDVAIRTGATISAAESIVIEDHVGMGANVTIIDSKHTWSSGHPNPMRSPVQTAPIRIGAGSWLADRVTVAAGAEIGERCAIGPNAVVSGSVPDFSVVLGNPGRVVGSTRA